MSHTLLGWLLIVCSIAIAVPLIFPLRSAAGFAHLSRLRSSRWGAGQDFHGTAGALGIAAAVFLLVAGIGAATSYVWAPPGAAGSGNTPSLPLSHSGLDGETLASLRTYARSIGAEEPASMAAAGELLPDVETMIERLAARLQTTPRNADGWRMLGWSYFNTGRYEQAAAAYARAVELDPGSAELKLSYEEAKAKASESGNPGAAASLQSEPAGEGSDGPSVEKTVNSDAMSPHEGGVAIRPRVDGR